MYVSDFIIFLYLDSVRLPWFFASTKQHDEDRSDSPNFQAQTLIAELLYDRLLPLFSMSVPIWSDERLKFCSQLFGKSGKDYGTQYILPAALNQYSALWVSLCAL